MVWTLDNPLAVISLIGEYEKKSLQSLTFRINWSLMK